jgi:hypothetical protein
MTDAEARRHNHERLDASYTASHVKACLPERFFASVDTLEREHSGHKVAVWSLSDRLDEIAARLEARRV